MSTTTKDTIRACADSLGLTMTAEFVPFSKSRNAGDKHKSLNWKVTLHRNGRAFLTTDYGAGIAHAPGYESKSPGVRQAVTAWECENGIAGRFHDSAWGDSPVRAKIPHVKILPELADVLASLSADANVIDFPTYEEWAETYGYDTDSRKGEAIYRACLELALKMRGALGEDGIRRLAEACQDY